MVSSTINPRWKRILSLFMYIILQYFFLTFEMTFAEGSSLSKADKVFLFQLTNLFISDMVMLGLIPIYRISSNDKRMLFLNLKTTQQMRLLKAFKVVRDNQKRKLKFIIGIMSSESKKSQSNKNIIFENELEESVEDEEQKAAIERLNRAYERFGKENINNMN